MRFIEKFIVQVCAFVREGTFRGRHHLVSGT